MILKLMKAGVVTNAHKTINRGKTVAAFVVLDVTALSHPPAEWRPCAPVEPGEGGERVPALRALLEALLDAAAKR